MLKSHNWNALLRSLFILIVMPYLLASCGLLRPLFLHEKQKDDVVGGSNSISSDGAMELLWVEPSPSSSKNVTATWTKAKDSTLVSQILQFYAGESCDKPLGNVVALDNEATTQPFTAPIDGVYTYKILSIFGNGTQNTSNCSPVMVIISSQPKVATPVIDPESGIVPIGTFATITCATDAATIYYTLNGDVPSIFSTQYTGPIEITESTIITAIAVKTGYIDSDIATAIYGIPGSVEPPVIDPPSGVVLQGTLVSITCPTLDAVIYYTVDGSTPDDLSPLYDPANKPVVTEANTTVKAIAYKVGSPHSSIAVANYVVPKVATPIIAPASGTVLIGTLASIVCATSGATIYYTLDGNPATTSSTQYTGPIEISSGTTINAIAVKAGYFDSDPAIANYGIPANINTPVIDPSSGEVLLGTVASITCSTSDAIIYYTMDGSDPNEGSILYDPSKKPSIMNSGTTVKAIAYKTGYPHSSIASETYTIPKVATPVIAPVGGEVLIGTMVSITSDTEGSSIYYTLNGATPSRSSTLYTAPIEINSATVINAIAVKTGYFDSDTAETIYSVPGSVEAPVIEPASGEVMQGTIASITCATPDAVIYYTTDGTDPNNLSAVYNPDNKPTIMLSNTTIKAIAYKPGFPHSSVTSETYTIPKVATPVVSPASGVVLIGTLATIACDTTGSTIYYTLDGSTPDRFSAQYTGPIEIDVATTISAIAVKTGYFDSDIGSAAYAIPGSVAAPVLNPSSGEVLHGTAIAITCATPGASIYYTVDGTAPDSSSTLYNPNSKPTITVTGTTIKAIAYKTGYPHSSVTVETYTIPKVATPTFSPTGGRIPAVLASSGGTVGTPILMQTTTGGATIYYTLDNSTPSIGSTLYGGPAIINSNITIKAYAIKTGYTDSDVATTTFSINRSPDISVGWAHGTVQVGNKFYVGTRTSPATLTVFNNPDDLSDYTTVTIAGHNILDVLIYDPVNDMLYGTLFDGVVKYVDGADQRTTIIKVNPHDITQWSIVYDSITPYAYYSGPIVTDGVYVYGASYHTPSVFFKIRISDWQLVAQNTWTGIKDAHSAQLVTYTGKQEMYVTTVYQNLSYFAKVNCADLTYSNVTVNTNMLTDDMACRKIDENGSICYAGSDVGATRTLGASINTSTMIVTEFVTGGASYGMFIYNGDLYSMGVNGNIVRYKNFNTAAPEYFATTYIPNEMFMSSSGKIFITSWASTTALYQVQLGN